jgi:histidinol-phosphatase (PHP family)
MIDYHVHTPLCNHAEGGMEAYVLKGVELGLKDICFLDHLTLPERKNGQSMRPGEVSLYFQGVQTLKYRYSELINVKAGLEIDFNPVYTDIFKEIVQTFSFDVIGSSLHSPAGRDVVSRSSAWGHGELDTDHIYDLYMTELDKMLDCDYFDVLCHLDLPKKFGRTPSQSVDGRFRAILEKIKDKDLTVEVNTSGCDHIAGEIYPSREIIVQCHDLGIPLTLGSDAHAPERIGMHYDRVLPLLGSTGHKSLSVFTKRRRTEVSITP